MIEFIAGVYVAKYCYNKWKKAFPDVTKEDLMHELAAKENELAAAREDARTDHFWMYVFAIAAFVGWLSFVIEISTH